MTRHALMLGLVLMGCGDVKAPAPEPADDAHSRLGSEKPDPQYCRTDDDCGFGSVCESCDSSRTGQCVTGCRDDRACKLPETCQKVTCVTCPCPAQCAPPPPPPACKDDSDCKEGYVCDGCSSDALSCVPGCRAGTVCASGEKCQEVTCVTCPCPGYCP